MKTIFISCLLLFTYVGFAQTIIKYSEEDLHIALKVFEKKLKEAILEDFDSISIQRLSTGIGYNLFEPSSFDEKKGYTYPLSSFLDKPYYNQAIERLFNSNNLQERLLGYYLIIGAGAKAYEPRILEQLDKKESEEIFHILLTTLLYLRTKETTIVFDAIFERKFKSDGLWYVGVLMGNLDKHALHATAYKRIGSDDFLTKVFAVNLLSYTGQNEQTNALLFDLLKTWDDEAKIQVLYVLKELRVGNLLEELEPLLANATLERYVLATLASSPTKEDLDYLKEKAEDQKAISRELLGALYSSYNPNAVQYWLELISTKKIAQCNYFSTRTESLLVSDALLPHLQKALVKVDDLKILRLLLEGLKGRTDEVSTQILLGLLKHEDGIVQRNTVSTLMDHDNPKVKEAMLSLLNQNCEDRSIIYWLIKHKVDHLQTVLEDRYREEENIFSKRTALWYLANFPKPRHLKLFKTILRDIKSDKILRRYALFGIGTFKDEKNVDFLIKMSEKETESNIIYYLRAFEEVDNPKVKAFATQYKDSKEVNVQRLASKILKN